MRHILLLLSPIICISCHRIQSTGDDILPKGYQEVKNTYMSLWESTNEKDGFLFFTDPHLLGYDDQFDNSLNLSIINAFSSVKTLYNNLPLCFCLCGGDWLNKGDSQRIAKQKLLLADSLMKTTFKPYYKMLGNHDTNYQGVISKEDPSRGDFPINFIENDYYPETKSAYYSFNSGTSEFFVLDSGLDWTPGLDDYRVKQLLWLSSQLCYSSCEHKIIGIHMFFNEPDITPMSKEIGMISEAFNSRGKYSLFDHEFDFSNAHGKVHFIIAGHRHVDFVESFNGIPVIGTCAFVMDGKNTFDVCFLDYDQGYIYLIRVGSGDNRRVKMFM